MTDEEKLHKATDEFFNLYWKNSLGEPPSWSDHWDFNSSLPNNNRRGCYALFKNEKILYIGVGIGKSFGSYIGSGLGDRLKNYWKVNKSVNPKTKYIQRSGWEELTSIMTIGFNEDHYPLAAALEVYLINSISPPKNIKHI